MIKATEARQLADNVNSTSADEILSKVAQAAKEGKYELRDVVLHNKLFKEVSDKLEEHGFKIKATSFSVSDRTTTFSVKW